MKVLSELIKVEEEIAMKKAGIPVYTEKQKKEMTAKTKKTNQLFRRLIILITIVTIWPASGLAGNLLLIWMGNGYSMEWSKAKVYGPLTFLTSVIHGFWELNSNGFFTVVLTVLGYIIVIGILAFVVVKVFRWLFGLGPIFKDNP